MSATHTETFPRPFQNDEIIGPYSAWPRETAKSARVPARRRIAVAAGVAGAAVFAHCVVPLV